MSKDNLLIFFKCFVVFIILLITINFLPINFYVDYEFATKRINQLNFDYIKFLPHHLIFETFKNKLFNSYNLIFHNIFILINFSILILPIIFHILFHKNDIQKKEVLNIYLSSVIFPISLQSITSPNSESVFSLIIIYITSYILCIKDHLKFFPIFFGIFIYLFFVDTGNWIVLLYFVLMLVLMLILNRLANLRICFLVLILVMISIIKYPNEILNFSTVFFNSYKTALSLIAEFENLGLKNLNIKDLFSRYGFYFLTLFGLLNHYKIFIFLTIFIFLVLSFYLIFITTYNFENYKNKFYNSGNIIKFLCLIFFPLFLICLLPTHAYAKYYIFSIPFIMKFLLMYFTINKLFIFTTIYSSAFILNSYLIFNFML